MELESSENGHNGEHIWMRGTVPGMKIQHTEADQEDGGRGCSLSLIGMLPYGIHSSKQRQGKEKEGDTANVKLSHCSTGVSGHPGPRAAAYDGSVAGVPV